MKAAWESTLVFISAGTACSQDQDGAVQIGRGEFGLGKSPGNGPVHSFSGWVACSRSAGSFMCHASPFTRERTLTGNTHTHTQKICKRKRKKTEKGSVVPLTESFYQLIWKCFPCGNHQSAHHKNSPQTGSPTGKRFERSTARRHGGVYGALGSEIHRGIMFAGAIEG